MDLKQVQDSFDKLHEFIKTEPEDIGSGQANQNKNYRKPQMFNNEQGDMLDIFKVDEIKEQINEYEMLKIEGRSDLPTKSDQDMFSKNVQIFPKTIKKEFENTSDQVTDISEIKQEVCENIQQKTESELRELLTSHCDLPILKIESTVDYLGHHYSSKPLKNNAQVLNKKMKMYSCPICQKNLPSKSRSTHIDGHFENSYTICQFCGKLMKKIEFFQHSFVHVVKNRPKHPINDKPLKHNISSRKLKQKCNDNVDDKSFKCDTCFKTFNRKYNLRTHLLVHRGKKRFKCDICSKGYIYKCRLQQHLIIHNSEKPLKCDICFKGFNWKFNLRTHVLIHSDEKPFKCNICFKGFTSKNSLQAHLKIHSNNSFKCDICSKVFNQKNTLNRHLKIHSGEKPFNCNICSKRFIYKYKLQKHFIIHSGENPFKCNICSKVFNQKYNLKQHLIVHSGEKPFKCDICFKGFNDKSNLRQHLKIHSNEKQFKCNICFKGYRRKSNLQKHLIIHTDEKPFKCDICSKSFIDKSVLQKHLIIHSVEKPSSVIFVL